MDPIQNIFFINSTSLRNADRVSVCLGQDRLHLGIDSKDRDLEQERVDDSGPLEGCEYKKRGDTVRPL